MDNQRRLAAMSDALAAYEAEFGSISDEEADAQLDRDRANAVWVRRGSAIDP